MATRLYLIRHGETVENVAHILQGQIDGNLSERGIQQAKDACEALRDVAFDAIVCSDLKRCRDTAAILNEAHGLEINYTKLLRERDWGSITGMVADGTTKITIPDDAESMTALEARAKVFLDFISNTYPGKTVLAVSHGFFCRVVQAVYHGCTIKDIVPMTNTEVRILELDGTKKYGNA